MLDVARLLGADDVIAKPFRAKDLLSRVQAPAAPAAIK